MIFYLEKCSLCLVFWDGLLLNVFELLGTSVERHGFVLVLYITEKKQIYKTLLMRTGSTFQQLF